MFQVYTWEACRVASLYKMLFNFFEYMIFIEDGINRTFLRNGNLSHWSLCPKQYGKHYFLAALQSFGHTRKFGIFRRPYLIIYLTLRLEKCTHVSSPVTKELNIFSVKFGYRFNNSEPFSFVGVSAHRLVNRVSTWLLVAVLSELFSEWFVLTLTKSQRTEPYLSLYIVHLVQ